MYDNNNQNNLEWFRARLGNITGSAVGNIMGTPRSKSDKWTATALNYLNQVAFERTMNPIVVNNDELFAQYITLTDVKSKAIQWGHQMEGEAAHLFAKCFYKYFGSKDTIPYELELLEPSSVKCEDLEHFAASPDRMFFNPETGEECCVEIKCPQGQAFFKYLNKVFFPTSQERRLEGLKSAEANYYWQVYAEMLATGASKAFFVVYNPFETKPLHVLPIERDEEVISQLKERIELAEAYIRDLMNLYITYKF